ncbi:MAG: hypothetical protein M3352_00770 [Bacteroidota bacterium]|nr:hypothetical protein [Bacteroidota bacterium]
MFILYCEGFKTQPMNDLPTDENLLSEIYFALQKLSIQISSDEMQYDLNKQVRLSVEHVPKPEIICTIDPRLTKELQNLLVNTITEIAKKNKIFAFFNGAH